MYKQWIIGLVMVAGVVSAYGEEYPSHSVRIFVPFAAGGGADLVARGVGAELAAKWGQPVVIENRTGAGSLIGAEAVAHSTPDGYTLLATTTQTFTTNRYLYKSLPYDPDNGFVPITLMVQADQFLLGNESLPAKDLGQLVALARQSRGRISYGSWGVGSEPQIIYEQLNKHEALDLLHVPYKGVAPVLIALLGGEIQLTVGSAGVAGQLITAGKLRPLAIAASKRSTDFPDVPTTAEQGYPYLRSAIMIGLFAPAGTPPATVDKIRNDVRSVLKSSLSAEKKVVPPGFDVVAGSGEELVDLIREETARVGEILGPVNTKPE